MSIFKRKNDFFNNDSEQPDDQPTKVVWTKISEPVQEDHSDEYRQLKSLLSLWMRRSFGLISKTNQ